MRITRRTALTLCAAPAIAQARPSVAITIDDVWWQRIPEQRRAEAEERLLQALGKARAFLFAIGQAVDNEDGAHILDRWGSAGHRIGNHTYNHIALNGVVAAGDFETGILRNEEVLHKHSGFRKWFRFPQLKEGNRRESRDTVRTFLAQHGYRNAAVTIDTSDWYYDQRLLERIQADRYFDVDRYREPYLDHIWDRAQYYDGLSREILGRSMSHIILLHYTLLNAHFLGNLLSMFRSKGWGVIDAEEAFSDPAFKRQPDTIPAGESLIWAFAKETGKFEGRLRYPGEDDVYEKPRIDRLGL